MDKINKMDAKAIKKINSKLANVKFWKRDLSKVLGVKPPQLSYWLKSGKVPTKYVDSINNFVNEKA